MNNIDHETRLKTAHLAGVARALLESGYTPSDVKLAFLVSNAHPATQLDTLLKEAANLDKVAVWGALAGAAVRGAGLLSKAAPKLMQGAKTLGQASGRLQGTLAQGGRMSQLAGKGVRSGGQLAGKAMKGLGRQAYQTSGQLRQGARAFQATPRETTRGFVLNATKGYTGLGQGKGLGGSVGRAGMYGSIGTALLGAGNATAQGASQQMRSPQMRMYGG